MAKNQTISEQLRRLIADAERRGITRYRIGLETGIAQSALSRFVHRETNLNLEAADALAEFFGVELRPRRSR